MATTEDVVQGIAELLETQYSDFLAEVEALYTDGVELKPLLAVEWEEFEDAIGLALPGAMILAQEETDDSLKDQIFESRVLVIIAVYDTQRRNVTKKIFRYGKALRRLVRPVRNRGLLGRVISAKVRQIRWSPTYMGPQENLYTRAFEAELVIRLQREGD
jgi:hypothetical protein